MSPKDPSFDPRQAALYHAGETVRVAHDPESGLAKPREATLAEATNAIVCGLIYVGDAIWNVDRPMSPFRPNIH